MLYAINTDTGEKIPPTKKAHAVCPGCKMDVRAKCGNVYTHHWAHVTKICDYWNEPESEWHREWKSLFPKEKCEVPFMNHIADAISHRGFVVEFQSSSISTEDIKSREECYKDMIWIINGNKFSERFYTRNKGDYETFTWYHARKTWLFATKDIYIDFGDSIFLIKKMHEGTRVHGWGKTINKNMFIKKLTNNYMETKDTCYECGSESDATSQSRTDGAPVCRKCYEKSLD